MIDRHVFLIGMAGSGKSSLGKKTASRLRLPYIDTDTRITQDGETLVSRDGLVATFTSDRLSFWQNGVETAWISNGQWCTRSLQVQQKLDLGPWQMSHGSGLTVRWIG